MKKLFFYAVFMMFGSNIHTGDKQITALTKERKDKSSLFSDTEQLAKAYALMSEQKFYPIQVGSKSISLEEFSELTSIQRRLVNRISHPGCCYRLCRHDYSIADEDDINRLEKEMPAKFMQGHKILKIKRPQILCNTKPCCADYCADLFCFGVLPAAPPFATGAVTLACGARGSCGVALPYLVAGLTQMLASIVCETVILSAATIRYFCCYDTEEYTFGSNADNDEEEVYFSSNSD